MKNVIAKIKAASSSTKNAAQGASITMMMLMSSPAFAQFEQQVNNKMSTISSVLIGVSGVTATIAAGYVGNKMMFGQAKWPEVSHVAMGGMFVAVASAFGAWIVA